MSGANVTQRLDCGHTVTVEVGTRLWCYYDGTFGVVAAIGREADPWHDFVCDGSPFKAAGSSGYYNAQRLACCECGVNELKRRREGRLVFRCTETWELVSGQPIWMVGHEEVTR